MKRTIITIISIIILFITATFIISYYIVNNGSFLTQFKYKSITNVGLNYYVYFEKVPCAKNYDVVVYDSQNIIIYKRNIDKNSTTITFDSLSIGEKYKIIVIANDKDGNKKSIKKPYTFVWNALGFGENNLVVMDNNNDYVIELAGDYKSKKYQMNIKKNDELIDTIDITKDTYTIENSKFKDQSCYYTFELIDDTIPISTFTTYNLMSPISDIKIINPNNGDMMDYNDVTLSFKGGENASNYLMELYQGEKLIRRKEIKDKNVILSNNLFEKASSYRVKITASYYDYVDYSKTNEINFSINAKESLKPVFTNYNSEMIKSGTKIKLLSPDKNATIYYTLDGSNPTENSIKYENEILISENTIIKAISKEEKKNDAIVSEFDFKIGSKTKYKVYLSASNQYNNLGVSEVGYTNEKQEMNDLTNYIEKKLNQYGVTTYRNEYGDINRWTADSTYLGVDLHLAIHSNASEDHTSYGIETWIENDKSKMYSLAQNIETNLMSIYYNKEDEISNRGVKYANGSLGEVNPLYTPCGILVEVAHHDFADDAKWIMENKQKIGDNIANSILEYFQIK